MSATQSPYAGRSPIAELLRDVKEHRHSFGDTDFAVLKKAICDIQEQSFEGNRLDQGLIIDHAVKPKYIHNVMLMTKPGFKDRGEKILGGIVINLYWRRPNVDVAQLVIHASDARPVQIGIRIKFKKFGGYAFYPCGTNQIRDVLNSI